MAVDADDVEMLQRYRLLIGLDGFFDIDAELGLFHAGGNIRMGLRIDIGIDAQTDRRFFADAGGDFVERGQFLVGLDVEHQDAGVERILDFVLLFADAGKNDFLGIAAGFERAEQLAAGDDIETAALFGEARSSARLELAFTEKQTICGTLAKAWSKTCKWRLSVARL